MSDDHEIMTSILDWFGQIEEWIPGAGQWAADLLIGPIPLAYANNAYDLADQWGLLADALNGAYEDVMQAANPILENWSGDGGAQVFVQEWFAYLEGLRQTAESAAQMQRGAQNFGLEVELMKFMAALNLIMLAVSLFMLIAAAIPTGGGSLGAAPGLFATCRIALGRAASNTVGKIASIAMRIVMKSLTRLFGKLPAAIARRLIPAAVRAAVPRLAGIVAERIATGMAKNVLGRMARSIAARGISKAVANRLAAQALRGLAGREIRGTLGRQAGREAQRLLAKEIRKQLLQKWARKEGQQVAESALSKVAAKQIEKSLLGREFAKYVGTRVAFGAGFMGGGNLLGQFGQMVSGNRTEGVDWSQVKTGAIQGAVFGAGMFGGVLGHSVGGALAGGGLTLGQEVYSYVESGHKDAIDWTAVGHSAVQGGVAGVVFGGQTALEHANLNLPHTRIGSLRIGADVHVLPGDHGGFNVVATRANGREGLMLTSDGYVAFQGRDGAQHIPDEIAGRSDVAGVVDQHFANLRVDPPATTEAGAPTAPASSGRIDVPAARADTSAGAPARSGDGGGGGGGGGPRQNVPGGNTGTRTAETGRSPDSSPQTGERVRVPGSDGASLGDHGGPPAERSSVPDGAGDRSSADSVVPSSTAHDGSPPDGGGNPPDGGPPVRAGHDTAVGDQTSTDSTPADHATTGESRTSADPTAPGGERSMAGGDRVPAGDGTPPGGDRVPAGGDRLPVGEARVPAGTDVPRSADALARPGADALPRDGAPTHGTPADRPLAGERGPAERGPLDRGPGDRSPADRGLADRAAPDRGPTDRSPADRRSDARATDGRETDAGARSGERRSDDVAPPARPADGVFHTEANGVGPRGDAPVRDAVPQPGENVAGRPEHAASTGRDGGTAARELGDDAPPPGGPPHDPTGARPETRHPGDEPVMRSAGAEVGEARTEESVRQGTVRMELHPDFPAVREYLNQNGFRLVEDPAGPRAVIRHVYDADGRTFLREEREVRHLDGMRFLDLEHEIDHVRQLMDRFHGELGTEAFRERANGTQVGMQTAPRILSQKYDSVVEYHVRLQEAIRLIDNRVDAALIREHLAGVDERRALMNQKIHSRDSTAQTWRRQHFSDIPALERRLGDLRDGLDNAPVHEQTGRPEAAERGEDPPRMAKTSTAGHAGEHTSASHEPIAERTSDGSDSVPDASTGASIRPRDEIRAFDWAEQAYERFRTDDADVAEIAGHLAETPRPDGSTGYPPAEIRQIKQHLMVEPHRIKDYDGVIEERRFDASPDIAEAWIRLQDGRALPEDLVLLNHELAESDYLRLHPEADYRTAHEEANRQHNWQDIVPARTGEDLDIRWGRQTTDGDSGRLPENPRGRETGGVSLRPPRDGSGVGDREGFAGGESGGRDSGSDVRGGVHEDSSAAAGTGDLAAGRDVRGVDPYRLVTVDGPAPEHPVAVPHEVAAMLESELTGLVEGREAGAADQPHRADWDPEARTLRVHYGDGLEVDVVVQVNESVPPGHSVVVRPPMEFAEGGGWRQTEPAGVVLSSHLPGDPVARGPHVHDALQEAWRTLHGEVGDQLRPPDGQPHDGSPPREADPYTDGPPRDADPSAGRPAAREVGAYADGVGPARDAPAPDALRALEDPAVPDVPVRDTDGVGRHQAEPTDPPPPAPLTPESVRQSIAGRSGPEQLGRWAGEHLADRAENGSLRPKPPEEIAATVDRLADQAVDRVTPARDRPPANEVRPNDEVRHNASPIEDTDFVPDGRAWHEPDVSVGELHRAVQGALSGDFADGRVSYVSSDGPYVRVEMADGSVRHFLPRVGEGMRDLAETTVRSGTPEDPHIVQVNNRVAGDQLSRVWVHEITETLALQHAAESRAQPHGLARRAMAAIGRIFGGGESARPEAARVDPHVAARINERLHLQRLHDWAQGRPLEQIRLRHEIDGVDRDLAALGHRVDPPRVERQLYDWGRADTPVLDGVIGGRHDVMPAHEPVPHEPVPREPVAEHAPAPPESSHDGHWTDKPWEREGRRPSFDELIPVTDAEALRWGGEVKAEFAREIEGRRFGDGFQVRFDPYDEHAITVNRNSVTLRLKVSDSDGAYAGRTTRVFTREHDGTLFVTHSSINLTDHAQGRGFSDAWNDFLGDWYREAGVSHIEVHAVDRGAYAWARAGFDWAPNTEHRANEVLRSLRIGIRSIDEHLDQVARWQRGEHPLDVEPLLKRYGVDHPNQLADRMRYEREAGRQILDRAARNPFGARDYPTPNEISRAGSAGRHGRDQVWLGKEALLGSDWKGVKPVGDGVVQHPHPRAEPPEGRPITASAVPRGDFHGIAREMPEPEIVRDQARAALDDSPPVRVGRLDLDTVPADRLPDNAVARSVPIDGAGHDLPDGHLPPPDGGYRIEVSDQAGDLAVPRAIRHEVAELNAIGERARAGLDLDVPDMLRPGEVPDATVPTSHDLSPHDLGRLAEVDYLMRLRADPAHAEYAARELAALRDHLGLNPDEPGAARRQAVVDEWLSRAGHDPTTTWDAPANGGPRHATELAVAARTPNGVPDPAAVADFVAGVPPLEVSPVRGVEAALEAFVRDAIGNDQAQLQAIAGGAGQGQSGAPVFLVREESGRLVAVAKIFPEVEELVRELSALERLGSAEFQTFDTPRVEGVATVPGPEGTAGALVMSVAPGRSIFEMIRDTADAADRTAALGDLHQAVGAAATALAELHGRPEGTGGPVDTGFLRFNHGLARREAAAVAEFGERLSALRIDPDGMVTRVAELLDAGLAEPGGASLMHGDAHPGNLFWDPSHGITLIDAPHAHFAMDQAGRPIGTPARDYANMMERLAHFGYEAGLSSPEVAALQTNFAETYAAMGGPPIPEAAVAAFTIRFALRDVLDTLTALRTIDQADSPFRAVRQETRMLREQLRTELGLLRRALGWTHE